jgi:hypothetical protein
VMMATKSKGLQYKATIVNNNFSFALINFVGSTCV